MNTVIVSCPVGQRQIEIPYDKYIAIIFDSSRHTTFSAIYIDRAVTLGCVASNFGSINNDSIVLNFKNIVLTRESFAGDYIVSYMPVMSNH